MKIIKAKKLKEVAKKQHDIIKDIVQRTLDYAKDVQEINRRYEKDLYELEQDSISDEQEGDDTLDKFTEKGEEDILNEPTKEE